MGLPPVISNTPASAGATLQIVETHVADLRTHRTDHFARLVQLPELYLELMVPHCRAYSLMVSGNLAGHALVAPDGTLIELSLLAAACNHRDRHFAEVCRALGIRKVLCFSFDSTLVSLCVASGADAHPHGMMYREFVPGTIRPLCVLRPAVDNDIPTLLPIRDDVFDEEEQVYRWVRSGWVFVLEEGNDFIGAGLCSPVWPDSPARDLGVLVHPSKRGLGHGRRILASLAEECLRTGLVPTGGCACDNLASRAALDGAGFISRHSLIEFRVGVASLPADSTREAEVARSLTGDARLLPFLPELLQDLWALGLGMEPTLQLLARSGVHDRAGIRVLDLGCGKGEALITLAERFGWRGEGVDLMPAFIEEARQRAAEHKVSDRVELEVGDLAQAAMVGEPVDIILFGLDSDSLGPLSDSLGAVQKRLVSQGLIVFATAWGRSGRPKVEGVLTETEARDAVREAGLNVIDEERSPADWVRSQNQRNTEAIRRRASELSRRLPEKRSWFEAYVRAQEDESRQLEEDLECVVLLLQRPR